MQGDFPPAAAKKSKKQLFLSPASDSIAG